MTTCKSCGAPIIWIQSPKGKWIPCDEGLVPYVEDKNGKSSIVTQRGEIIRCRFVNADEATGFGRVSHWGTCPNAEQHRRKKS